MISIEKLRNIPHQKILLIGNHAGIIQSILDFDFLREETGPSIIGIVGVKQKSQRYFWGDKEILLPGYLNIEDIDQEIRDKVTLFAVAQSGRRVLKSCKDALAFLPNCIGGMVFAEGVPERHAIEIRKLVKGTDTFVVGPASVGMLVAGSYKLGAIGGTMPDQINNSRICEPGSVAVVSSSGGMINEIIYSVARHGGKVSVAVAIGGERFPITKPVEIIQSAIEDKYTEQIIYFGELGGEDEYEIAEYYKTLKKKKPIIAYIAGTVAEKIENAPQFGHAKSLAHHKSETASAKKKVLRDAGVNVADSLIDFESKIQNAIKKYPTNEANQQLLKRLTERKKHLLINGISSDSSDGVKILNESLTDFVNQKTLSEIALTMFLGQKPKTKKLTDCFDVALRLLVDHGPQVSGAVNTMITARAGRDLTASLAAGLLTIGPRFGGALNDAASHWFDMVNKNVSADEFVSQMARQGQNIPGIGHKKYRADDPDPRIRIIKNEVGVVGKYTHFALDVESITTRKRANLILNIDGYIAAVMLDIFHDYEKLTKNEIRTIIDSEFFNALFVYARTVGFIAHHIEQKRIDEPLFRLPQDLIADYIPIASGDD